VGGGNERENDRKVEKGKISIEEEGGLGVRNSYAD
jgi:hypothetical protein